MALPMLATFGGSLALALGLLILALPLLVTELSRPRDSAWGAVVLLLGLVLVTSAERLTGAPMLAVLCGGLLIGRLGSEVAQGRWRALSDEERAALLSAERWSRSLEQLAASANALLQAAPGLASGVSAWLAERRQGRSHGKRWVRREGEAQPASVGPTAAEVPQHPAPSAGESVAPQPDPALVTPGAAPPAAAAGDGQEAEDPGVRVVSDFREIEALVDAAPVPAPADPPPEA